MESDLKNLEQKINDLTGEKKDLLNRYAKGEMTREAYARKAVAYDQSIKNTKTEREGLIKIIPILHQDNTIENSIKSYCESVKSKLEKCDDFDSKRQLALDYIEKIIFTNGKVELLGSIPIKLKAYADPDQTSEANKIEFKIQGQIDKKLFKKTYGNVANKLTKERQMV